MSIVYIVSIVYSLLYSFSPTVCSMLYFLSPIIGSSIAYSLLYSFPPIFSSLLYYLPPITSSSTVCSPLHPFPPIVCSMLYFLPQILCLIFCTFFWFFLNLFQFLIKFVEFLEEKRESVLTNACKALAKHWLSRHHPMFGLTYIIED